MIFSKSIKIEATKVEQVIIDYDLKIYHDIWHYSFNNIFERNFFIKKDKNNIINLFSNPLNQFCPALIYTNNNNKTKIKIKNLITDSYNFENKVQRKVFWYLKIISFQDFLERKTKRASRPREHFPTSVSYSIYKKKHPVNLYYGPFDKNYFVDTYNDLKLSEHLSGEEVVNSLIKNNPGLPSEWLRIATLTHNNEIVAVAFLIDDNKSIFIDNMAAKRTKVSYGVYLLTELLRHASENNYYSFDGGVSNIYGVYKNKIFLDSKEVYQNTSSWIRYLTFYEKSYWTKVHQKIKNTF